MSDPTIMDPTVGNDDDEYSDDQASVSSGLEEVEVAPEATGLVGGAGSDDECGDGDGDADDAGAEGEADAEIQIIGDEEDLDDDDFQEDDESEDDDDEFRNGDAISQYEHHTVSRETLYMTKYEKPALIGIRAGMLDNGAPPLVDTHGLTTTWEIAQKELDAGVLPLMIERPYPNGQTKIIPSNTLVDVQPLI